MLKGGGDSGQIFCAPPYDHAEITALAGATMAYEYLSLIAKAKS